MKRYILLLIVFVCACQVCLSQTDPDEAILVASITAINKKMYAAQIGAQAIQSAAQIWSEDEISGARDYQKKFYDYVNTVHNPIVYVAQTYGLFQEFTRMLENIQLLKEECDNAGNALAAALHPSRNDAYVDFIEECVDLFTRAKQVCSSKMTVKERYELLLSLRPEMKKFNVRMRILSNTIHYTRMWELWGFISGEHPKRGDKAALIKACHERWCEQGYKYKNSILK